MAEAIGSRTEIQTLLADNTSGAISPEDVRSAILTVFNRGGLLSVPLGVSAQAVTSTPAKLTCWSTAASAEGVTSSTSTDDHTILKPGVWLAGFQASFTTSGANNYAFTFRLDGSAVSGARCKMTAGATSTYYSVCMIFPIIVASANQVLTVYVEGPNSVNITVEEGQFWVRAIA